MEIIGVCRDDWYPSPDEDGRSVYAVKYRDTDGLLYVITVIAKDELDAAMHIMKEQTNGTCT